MNILQVYLILILVIFNLLNLFLIKFLSRKYYLYDEPNHRKQHTKPTSYLGGILFFLSNLDLYCREGNLFCQDLVYE